MSVHPLFFGIDHTSLAIYNTLLPSLAANILATGRKVIVATEDGQEPLTDKLTLLKSKIKEKIDDWVETMPDFFSGDINQYYKDPMLFVNKFAELLFAMSQNKPSKHDEKMEALKVAGYELGSEITKYWSRVCFFNQCLKLNIPVFGIDNSATLVSKIKENAAKKKEKLATINERIAISTEDLKAAAEVEAARTDFASDQLIKCVKNNYSPEEELVLIVDMGCYHFERWAAAFYIKAKENLKNIPIKITAPMMLLAGQEEIGRMDMSTRKVIEAQKALDPLHFREHYQKYPAKRYDFKVNVLGWISHETIIEWIEKILTQHKIADFSKNASNVNAGDRKSALDKPQTASLTPQMRALQQLQVSMTEEADLKERSKSKLGESFMKQYESKLSFKKNEQGEAFAHLTLKLKKDDGGKALNWLLNKGFILGVEAADGNVSFTLALGQIQKTLQANTHTTSAP